MESSSYESIRKSRKKRTNPEKKANESGTVCIYVCMYAVVVVVAAAVIIVIVLLLGGSSRRCGGFVVRGTDTRSVVLFKRCWCGCQCVGVCGKMKRKKEKKRDKKKGRIRVCGRGNIS